MQKSKIAVLTTAFTQNTAYTHKYFASLEAQSFKKFDVIIVNDGCLELDFFRSAFSNLNIIEFAGNGNLAKNRQVLINSAIDLGYEKVIFADFDDYFSPDRVVITVRLLDSADIVVNELKLVSSEQLLQGEQFGQTLQDHRQLVLQDVLQMNCFGLSNTGIRLTGLEKVYFDDDLKVVDWYFFSSLLSHQKTAIYTNQCWTYYRQHEHTMAHIRKVSKEQLRNEIIVKKKHYSLMVKDRSLYEPLLKAISDFPSDEVFLDKYFSLIQKKLTPFWWSLFDAEEYWKIKYEINK